MIVTYCYLEIDGEEKKLHTNKLFYFEKKNFFF